MTRLMLLISSNNRIDRDGEIVTEQALTEYVARAHNADGDYIGANDLLWWHGGDPIGAIIECDMMYGFLVEIAMELPNRVVTIGKPERQEKTTIKQVWDMVESDPKMFGVSQGAWGIEGDDEDGVFDEVEKFESSILPIERASNPFTGAWVFTDD